MKRILIIVNLLVLSATLPAQFKPPGGAVFRAEQEKAESEAAPRTSGKYVLLSMVLPGAGEWFMGHKGPAKFFLGTELALWAGYLGTQGYIGVLENDFHSYAAVHAGVNTSGKNDQFWIDIGNSDNIYTYNEKRLVERRLQDVYPEDDAHYWQWDSKTNRDKYNDMRFKQHDWKQRANIIIGGVILNRLISAIDVIRLIRKEKRADNARYSRLYFNYRSNRWEGEVYRLNFGLNW